MDALLACLRAGHAAPVVADVRERAVDALALRALRNSSVLADGPRAASRAPARADPAGLAPRPPPGHARVVEVGVGHEPLGVARRPPRQQGEVSRVEVRFAHGPRRRVGHRVRVAGDSAPRVAEEPVEVVDRLAVVRPISDVRATEEHREGARERLDVVVDVPERSPYRFCGVGLAAEPRPRRLVQAHERHGATRAATRAASRSTSAGP